MTAPSADAVVLRQVEFITLGGCAAKMASPDSADVAASCPIVVGSARVRYVAAAVYMSAADDGGPALCSDDVMVLVNEARCVAWKLALYPPPFSISAALPSACAAEPMVPAAAYAAA